MICTVTKPLLAGACAAALLTATPAVSQTIYPIDRADVLIGQKFDLKVEFPGIADPAKAKITINGKDHAALFGKAATFVRTEVGVDASALLLREVTLDQPGAYTVTATDGVNTSTVTWTAYATGPRRARNVILIIGDGMGIAHRTAARIMSKGIKEGKYYGKLAMDDMPHMALIGTSGVDSVVTDSANSAHAYSTGHKSNISALGVYVDRTPDNYDDPKVEHLAEFVKRRKQMAVGIVTDADLPDATPAGMVAHIAKRQDSQIAIDMLYALKPEVMMGGGAAYFLPKSPNGIGKRTDGKDYVAQARSDGYQVATTATEMATAAGDPRTKTLLGLYNKRFMDGHLDRAILKPSYIQEYPEQPDLPDMAKAGLDVLSRHPNGFFLMIEAGLIDKYSHVLDGERAVYDTIMLDKTVRLVKEFAEKRGDTLVLVTPDHTHAISLVGTVDDNSPVASPEMRERIGVYGAAGYPNYVDADGDGYPDRPDPSKRLYMTFGLYPDHYETFRPKLDGMFTPAVMDPATQKYVANEAYKDVPGAVLMPGNIPRDEPNAPHVAHDVLLTAMGPGSARVHGFMDNTEVFRTMAEALGLGHQPARRRKAAQ
ncbi:alkaline phosphatase [Azospirillum sp.]|uniref:alkaline phosphatase n=1 Tax=Azospirillum sp. TaxID=34012 RepID=UPI00260F127F|nr:alkaline phosphatase [Azospirillum sp.]